MEVKISTDNSDKKELQSKSYEKKIRIQWKPQAENILVKIKQVKIMLLGWTHEEKKIRKWSDRDVPAFTIEARSKKNFHKL